MTRTVAPDDKYKSFQRQLNNYDFHKYTKGKWVMSKTRPMKINFDMLYG